METINKAGVSLLIYFSAIDLIDWLFPDRFGMFKASVAKFINEDCSFYGRNTFINNIFWNFVSLLQLLGMLLSGSSYLFHA